MSEPQLAARSTRPEHVLAVSTAPDLARIEEARWNLGIWERRLSPELEQAVRDPRFDRPLHLRRRLDRGHREQQIDDLIREADLEDPGSADVLRTDLQLLARTFFDICTEDSVRLSLDRVVDGMCRAFHVDYYQLRLICTYRGAGTEWLSNDDVHRAALREGPGRSGKVRERSGIARTP